MIPQTAAQAAIQSILDGFAERSLAEIVLGLDRITQALDRLGNPHEKLPPVIHIAGTNGKGSTCAYLRAALEAAGKSVHVFTSPHLVRFNERIRVAGSLIEDNLLANLLREVLDVAEAQHIGTSFFEAATAAAFLPLLGALAMAQDVSPLLLTVPAAIAASCAFMMPVATPPNAIVFSSGHMQISDMIKAGFVLNLMGIVVVTLITYGLLGLVFTL